ncbi:MAG: NAD(P)H-hydrate dehydratase [Acidimicrobiales bacterium]|nr:NAD(P)H-hydrate dehydratase [Acidimicrobiales bacterium]
MIPVLTPEEMGAVDRAAPEPVEVLIGRAGGAVARAAVRLLGGTYGRRVVVVAGKGNNGNDGREAARRLRARGVRVAVFDAAEAPAVLPRADLVIDAAFGTGFRGTYAAPDPAGAPVLAVDIPSGVAGLTGEVGGTVNHASCTVTFAALKPGLLLEPGATLAGRVEVADIGLDASQVPGQGPTPTHLVQAGDVAAWWPRRPATTHKWQRAVWVIGGSPGLEGAAVLATAAAVRSGAGYVRWSSPGEVPRLLKPTEVVGTALPVEQWADAVLADSARFRALVVGNGLGLDAGHTAPVRRVVAESPVPVVVDADALTLLGAAATQVVGPTTVLTPHDGEFERLAGHRPGPDRLAATRDLAARLGCVVALKGPLTVVAEPGGSVLCVSAGDARLATLGTGDVLAGLLGALCAQGLDPFRAAAAAAFLHGSAGVLGWRHGLAAGDLPELIPAVLERLIDRTD